MIRTAFALFGLGLVAACSTSAPTGPAPGVPELTFDADFRGRARCLNVSPPMRLYDPPAATRRLRLEFAETSSLSGRRTSFETAYAGRGPVPAGAFRDFVAPCPPNALDYDVFLTALGADGAVLARGRQKARLPIDTPAPGRGLNVRNQ